MPSDTGPEGKSELQTWQQIADYLQVSVRTAQNYEKQIGLPVRRITEGPRGRVSAFTYELDRWRAERLVQGPSAPGNFPSPVKATARRKTLWLAASSVGLGFLLAFLLRPAAPEPRLLHGTEITKSLYAKLSPLVTDGSRLYFGEYENGHYRVVQVPVEGGASVPVPISIPNPELCDIAPDGSALLLRSIGRSRNEEAPLYLQPLDAPNAKRLGHLLAYDAAWHPDGRHIVYTLHGVCYRTGINGEPGQRFLSVAGNVEWIRWSPDGKRIRFTVIDPLTEATALWEADAEGRNPHRLFPNWNAAEQQCCGSWTPDGKYFVFQVRHGSSFQIWGRNEGHNLLYKMNHTPVALTSGPLNSRGPLLSRDGKKLFVRSQVSKSQLVRFDAKLGGYVALLPGISVRTAAFSRDGQWIAYGSLTENSLRRCRADGSEDIRLTVGLQQAAVPRWSPDDRRIAFMGRHFGETWSVFVIAAKGDGLKQLSSGAGDEGYPDWSPDGKQLVFGNVLEPAAQMAVHIRDLETGHLSVVPESKGYFLPRWSPDGRFLAALRKADKRLGLFDFRSQQWTLLTTAETPTGFLNWSHDGKHVYFSSAVHGRRAIYRVDIRSKKLEPVASLENVEQGPFILGGWTGLSPDDSPLAVRNLTTEDLYAWDFERK